MASFRELLCEKIHGSHLVDQQGVIQLGYSTESFQWEFIITCGRCGKSSVMNRSTLDEILFKQSEEDKDSGTKPGSDSPK